MDAMVESQSTPITSWPTMKLLTKLALYIKPEVTITDMNAHQSPCAETAILMNLASSQMNTKFMELKNSLISKERKP